MKLIRIYFIALLSIVVFNSCEEGLLTPGLTEAEVAAGLKKALQVGTDTSVSVLSQTNGYFADQAVKILLPSEVQTGLSLVKAVPGASFVIGPLEQEFVRKMNASAEHAAVKAKPIFVNAITGITIKDAWNILRSGDTAAATAYLQVNTNDSLVGVFKPDIEKSMNEVGAESAWNSLATNYNSFATLAGAKPLPASISQHITERAISGLYLKVAEEERKIRRDPLHRVTDLLKKVFGELDK